ncbi:MAG: 4-hydroxy-tetrahydrodipicolinate reductase [Thermotogae bacterium]|nr:4-hydroxy-tetrahydrodipicolinate reductase [Thermotogota bacterium]
MKPKVVLVGYGRMGKEVKQVLEEKGYPVVGVVERDTGLKAIDEADVVVEFALPEATLPVLEYAAERGKRYVLGTTGHTMEQIDKIRKLAQRIAVLHSPNFSRGIALLKLAIRSILPFLEGWDKEIVEIHHRWKKDAPSGTALALAHLFGEPINTFRRGKRLEKEVGVFGVRGGDVFGDHTVFLLTEGERLELTHRLTSRRALALGVPAAIDFIMGKEVGFFTYDDVFRELSPL